MGKMEVTHRKIFVNFMSTPLKMLLIAMIHWQRDFCSRVVLSHRNLTLKFGQNRVNNKSYIVVVIVLVLLLLLIQKPSFKTWSKSLKAEICCCCMVCCFCFCSCSCSFCFCFYYSKFSWNWVSNSWDIFVVVFAFALSQKPSIKVRWKLGQ